MMASTFSIKTKAYQGRYLILECTQEKDIANNRSKIKWKLTSTGGKSTYYSTGATTVKINGEQVYYKARTAWDSYSFPAAKGSVSGETYVYHDINGDATITCSIKTAIYTSTLSTVSDNWILDSNPRAAKLIDAPDLTDETDSITISFDNLAGAATEEIWFCIGDTADKAITTYRQITDLNATSFTYQIDENEKILLRQAANKNEITVRYYLRTTIGGNPLFSTLDKKLTIVNPKPLLNPSIKDVGSTSTRLTGNPTGRIIKGFNSMEYLFNATPQKESSIVSYSLTCGGEKINNDNSNKAYNVVNGDFVFSVTDSRGNTATVPITFDVVDYVFPSISQSVEMEMDGETGAKVKLRIEGNYFNGTFGAVDNSLTLEVKHTQNDGSEGEWVNLDALMPEFDGNTYSLETTITGLVYDRAYTFICRATDATGDYNSVETTEYTIRLIPVFDWGENDFKINVPLYINSNEGIYLPYTEPFATTPTMEKFIGIEKVPFSSEPDDIGNENTRDVVEIGFKDIDETNLSIYGGSTISLNAANIYINEESLADFPIEQGIEGVWSYTKWNSGKVELVGTVSNNVAITEQKGALYRTNGITASLPFTVYDCKYWVSQVTDGNVWAAPISHDTNTNYIKFVLWCVWSTSSTTYETECKVIGNWK